MLARKALPLPSHVRQHHVNRPGFEMVMTPDLEKALDEGMDDLDHARTTEDLRRRL
jgi:hypothetical protein